MARYKRQKRRRSTLGRVLDFLTTALLLLAVVFAVSKLSDFSSEELAGQFKVIDGDSLTLGTQQLRLKGIDAPEYRQMCQGSKNGSPSNWNCGKASAAHLRALIAKSDLVCKGQEYDKYDRLLVKCIAAGSDINRQMVADGMAVAYGNYYSQEASAKKSKLGIWRGDFENPQDWREAEREGGYHGQSFRDQFSGWIDKAWSWMVGLI